MCRDLVGWFNLRICGSNLIKSAGIGICFSVFGKVDLI